jgi:hypothetical protein
MTATVWTFKPGGHLQFDIIVLIGLLVITLWRRYRATPPEIVIKKRKRNWQNRS